MVLPANFKLMNAISACSKHRLIRSLLWLFLSASFAQVVFSAEAPIVANSDDTNQDSLGSQRANDLDGLLLTSRIIGGQDAEADSWPSIVALVKPGTASVKNRFFCGATVVAERWVMTAAHCVFNAFGRAIEPSSVRVIAGIRNLDNDVPQEELAVTNIIVHPDYNDTLDLPPFDIALLELGSAINAPIVSLFAGDTADYYGFTSYIVGWGATHFVNESNAIYPSQLQDAAVPIVLLSICNSIVSYQGLVTHRQVCAGFIDGGVDACVGDSGGPLFMFENGTIKQMGITSFGNGCALANFYGIYTSVTHLLPWLYNYIDVPFQTPELITQLDAGETIVEPGAGPVTSTERKGRFFGAIHPWSGFGLLICLLFRRFR
ncbi:MAG: secreted trypsin-like serine protease [Porticoccaceae bacterium]|jgi:secreted trypsin-like serine protease